MYAIKASNKTELTAILAVLESLRYTWPDSVAATQYVPDYEDGGACLMIEPKAGHIYQGDPTDEVLRDMAQHGAEVVEKATDIPKFEGEQKARRNPLEELMRQMMGGRVDKRQENIQKLAGQNAVAVNVRDIAPAQIDALAEALAAKGYECFSGSPDKGELASLILVADDEGSFLVIAEEPKIVGIWSAREMPNDSNGPKGFRLQPAITAAEAIAKFS